MPDAGAPPPLDASAARTADPGPPVCVRFDGIADGMIGDEDLLRSAFATRCAYGDPAIERDGPKFTVLFRESECGPAAMTDANRTALVDALRRVAAGANGAVESTLRCTEVFRDVVRETMFTFDDGEIRALSRDRPVSPEDRARAAAGSEPAGPPISGMRLSIITAAFLVAFTAVAWSSGWIDRVAATKSEDLVVDTGPFGNALSASVSSEMGTYVVKLRRGAAYPVSAAEAADLASKAATPAERVALGAVESGGLIWLRLETSKGDGLAAASTSLAALATSADREIEVRLPGRIGAATIELAVEPGADLERR